MSFRRKVSYIYKIALEITNSPFFDWFILIVIASNTVMLSLDHYPINFSQTIVTERLNIIFTVIFCVELTIKLVAYGFKNFFKGSWFNSFDSLIVIASLIDIIISNVLIAESEYSGSMITVLRGFRLLRLFKLAKQWRRFELLLETMGKSLKDIANFSIFLFLFIFIFTLLALELFAYKAKIDPETEDLTTSKDGVAPSFNFDNFLNSFSLVFIILTNDG